MISVLPRFLALTSALQKPASKVRGLPKVIRDLLKNSALAPHDQDGEPDEIDFLS